MLLLRTSCRSYQSARMRRMILPAERGADMPRPEKPLAEKRRMHLLSGLRMENRPLTGTLRRILFG